MCWKLWSTNNKIIFQNEEENCIKVAAKAIGVTEEMFWAKEAKDKDSILDPQGLSWVNSFNISSFPTVC